jgi:hypothetical protein
VLFVDRETLLFAGKSTKSSKMDNFLREINFKKLTQISEKSCRARELDLEEMLFC